MTIETRIGRYHFEIHSREELEAMKDALPILEYAYYREKQERQRKLDEIARLISEYVEAHGAIAFHDESSNEAMAFDYTNVPHLSVRCVDNPEG